MSDDLDPVIARLVTCLEVVTASVPDEAPSWDPRAVTTALAPRRRHRQLLAVAAAIVVSAIVVPLTWPSGGATSTVRAELIAASARTLAAQTARMRFTLHPSQVELNQGVVGMTATGVVDFAVPALRWSYPSGFSVIEIGNRAWQTVWPPSSWPPVWEVGPPVVEPVGTTAKQRQLDQALSVGTAPKALLAALRSDTVTFAFIGTAKLDGTMTRHYRSRLDRFGDIADVWVGDGRLLQIEVHGSDDGGWETVTDYYDYGVAAQIRPPVDVTQGR